MTDIAAVVCSPIDGLRASYGEDTVEKMLSHMRTIHDAESSLRDIQHAEKTLGRLIRESVLRVEKAHSSHVEEDRSDMDKLVGRIEAALLKAISPSPSSPPDGSLAALRQAAKELAKAEEARDNCFQSTRDQHTHAAACDPQEPVGKDKYTHVVRNAVEANLERAEDRLAQQVFMRMGISNKVAEAFGGRFKYAEGAVRLSAEAASANDELQGQRVFGAEQKDADSQWHRFCEFRQTALSEARQMIPRKKHSAPTR